MSQVTRGQKIRLGVFLIGAATLLAGTLAILLGLAILEPRDTYLIRFSGSVSGLAPGAQVRFNGVPLGRVESIRIDPEDVSGVEVKVSLEGGTPVKTDSVAVLTLQGITGLKLIEIGGGSNSAARLPAESRIQSASTTLDLLSQRASAIATKLEALVTNLVDLTGGDTKGEVVAMVTRLGETVDTARDAVQSLSQGGAKALARADRVLAGAEDLMTDGRTTLSIVQTAMIRISHWVDGDELLTLMKRAGGMSDAVSARLSSREGGKTLKNVSELAANANRLVRHLDIALLQMRDDLGHALDEFVIGAENFSEFANVLRDDPSAILRGRADRLRELPRR